MENQPLNFDILLCRCACGDRYETSRTSPQGMCPGCRQERARFENQCLAFDRLLSGPLAFEPGGSALIPAPDREKKVTVTAIFLTPSLDSSMPATIRAAADYRLTEAQTQAFLEGQRALRDARRKRTEAVGVWLLLGAITGLLLLLGFVLSMIQTTP